LRFIIHGFGKGFILRIRDLIAGSIETEMGCQIEIEMSMDTHGAQQCMQHIMLGRQHSPTTLATYLARVRRVQ